ncbi:MAG: ABC transporter permease [Gemmatimonadaceae bacterium]
MVDSPSKLWAIIRREYLERVRTKWFVISTVFGPIIFSLLIFLPLLLANRETDRGSHRLIILDATGTSLGRYVAGALASAQSDGEQAAPPDVQVVSTSGLAAARASATQDVTMRLASGFLVLDSSTVHGISARYAGRRSDSRSGMTSVTEAVRAGLVALSLERQGVPTAALDSVVSMHAPVLSTTSIDDTGKSAASPAKGILAFFVAFLLYTSILIYGQSILSGVIEEKLSRVAEIVISSVRPETLLAGKVLGVTAVGVTQQLLWILGSILIISGRTYIFGAPSGAAARPAAIGNGMASGDFLTAMIATPWSWVLVVLLFFILGFIFYGSLYAAVGATVGSEQEARQASQPVVMLLILTIVFISPTLANPNSNMARTMSLLPFSSPILMPLRMATTDVPALEVAASILILVAGCVGAVWLAARIYRVGLLMYGKRPTLKELRRWIAAS